MPSALSLFPGDIPVFVNEDMTYCELHQRLMWLREVIDVYCSPKVLATMKTKCPSDPEKFEKIRRHRERQLAETESRIAELESARVYSLLMEALF